MRKLKGWYFDYLMIALVVGMILIAAVIWFAGGAHAQQQGPIYCSQMATSTSGFTTKVEIIPAPGTGTSRIFICGYAVSAALTSVITFQTGTGANCATGSTAIGPTIQLPATGAFGEDSQVFRGFQVANPLALCVTATAAANMVVYFERQ